MATSEIIINLTGKAEELKPLENALNVIISKAGDVGEMWGKTIASMNAATKAGADGINQLAKGFDTLAVSAKNADKAIAGGAFKDLMKQLETQIGLTNKEMTSFVQSARDSAQQALVSADTQEKITQLTTAIEAMTGQLEQMTAWQNKAGTETKTLKAELEALVNKLGTLDEGSAEFAKIAEEAGKVSAKIETVNTTVSRLGSNTAALNGLVDIAGGVSNVFGVAQGALALFGDESEELNKAITKINAVMSILQGLQAIQNVLQKESAASLFLQSAATETLAGAEVIQTGATEGATIAQAGLNAMMLANPVGLVIAGISALIGIFALLDYAANSSRREFEKHSETLKIELDALKELNDLSNKPYEDRIAAQEAENNKRKAGNITTKETIDNEKKLLDLKKGLAEKNKDTFEGFLTKEGFKNLDDANTKIQDLEKSLESLKLAKQEAPGSLEASFKEIATHIPQISKSNIQDAIDAGQKRYDVLKDGYDKALTARNEYNKANNEIDIANTAAEKKINDDNLKSLIAYQEAKVSATIAGSDAERTAQINAIKATLAYKKQLASEDHATPGELAKMDADAEREIRGLQLANYQHFLKGRTALEESFIAEAKIAQIRNEQDSIESINKLSAMEIEAERRRYAEAKSDPTLNKGEKEKIKQETNLRIAELEKQHQLDILNIQKSGINAQLILSAKGSEEEYSNKIKLIDKEQEIELAATKLTKDQIEEINNRAVIAREDALKERRLNQLQSDKALLDIEVQNAVAGSKVELIAKTKDIDAATALELAGIDQRVAATEEGQKKIAEINNRNKNEKVKIQLEFDLKSLDGTKQIQDSLRSASINADERIINSVQASSKQRKQAEEDIYKLKMEGLQNDKNIIEAKIKAEEEAAQKIKGTVLLTADEKLAIENKYLADLTGIQDKATDLQYQKEQEALKKKSEIILQSIESTKKILQEGIGITLDTSAAKTALLELTNLADTVYKTLNDKSLSQDEKNRAVAGAAIEAGQQIVNQLFADSSAARQQQLDDTLAQLEDQKSKELDNKNLTEQQKADIAEKYKQKERQEKIKAFQADKDAKKTQAIINGLLGITNAFATSPFPVNIVMAALVAASTAIQVAKINSTPIPKFKAGKQKGFYEGLGIVDDGGRIEPILRADGSVEFSTGKPKDRLTYLAKDDIVFPSMDHLYKHFSFPEIPGFIQTAGNSNHIDYEKLAEAMANKMAGIIPAPAQIHNNFDGDDVKRFIISGSNKTEIKNKYFSMS